MADASIPFIAFTLFFLSGLAVTVLNDPYIRRKQRQALLLIILLCSSLVIQNYVENMLASGPTRWLERTLAAIYGYAVRPAIIVLFFPIVAPKKRFWPAWVLVGVNAAVHLTALFSDICFRISETNHYTGGPLRHCCLYISLLLLANLLYLTIRERKGFRIIDTLMPAMIIVMIVFSIWLDGQVGDRDQPIAFLTVAMSAGCVFYYIWLHLQFVREHEEDLKAQQRIRIMMSQIKPHFLYNTLSTIQVLCHTDPDKAAGITGNFSAYLRQNLSSMNEPDLIPFRKELEHTRTYVDIEEVRFPNIHVSYDIQDSDFFLPPLTLQPMVENAIRHGVRIREEGIVEVSTRRLDDCHELVIRDNGKGFDPAKLKIMGDSHVGLRNVWKRIEDMCGGTLAVDSRIDEGTTITIRIPLTGKDKEGTA